MLWFELSLITLAIFAALSIVWYTVRTGITPMPSSRAAKRIILDDAVVAGEGSIIDLGSGWGGLAIAFAKRYPDHRVIGYELSFFPWLFSLLVKRFHGLNNLTFYRHDFMLADLSQAALLLCYLYPGGMSDLKEKLDKECHEVVLLVSNNFALPGARAEKELRLRNFSKTPIYFYRYVNLMEDS